MKKIIWVLAFIAMGTTFAQSYSGKGDSKLNTGFEIYGQGSGLKATYDYGLNDLFSIGAGTAFFFSNDDEDYFLFARTGVHLGHSFDLPNELDVYPGVNLGYLSSGNVGIQGYIGIRYFFSKQFGLFAEIGSSGTVGLSICL